MSQQPLYVFRFEMDIHDRMRKALRVADLGVQDIAEVTGVHRNSVSAWLNGRSKPSDIQLKKFALRTGAPLEWLVSGDIKEHAPTPSGGGAQGENPPTLRYLDIAGRRNHAPTRELQVA